MHKGFLLQILHCVSKEMTLMLHATTSKQMNRFSAHNRSLNAMFHLLMHFEYKHLIHITIQWSCILYGIQYTRLSRCLQHVQSTLPDCLQLLSSSSPLDTEICLAMPADGRTSSEKNVLQQWSSLLTQEVFLEKLTLAAE